MFIQNSKQKYLTTGALVLSLYCWTLASAQNAADYFPSKTGNSWTYQQFTLDTLQHQVIASKTIVVDSLRGAKIIKGLTASVIVNGKTPAPDSTILNVQGSTIFQYTIGYPRITKLLPVDDLGLGFVWNYAAWYPYMKFGASPGLNIADTLVKIDTIVAFQSSSLPLQVYVSAMRRNDVSITVPAGTYSTTPFVITLTVNTYIIQPPFGHVTIRLFSLSDTMFVTKNTWLVKEVQPSTFYPLNNPQNYNVAITQLPGFVRVLESASITLSVAPRDDIPQLFTLEQNFPNPFNPQTHLRFTVSKLQFVSLLVFDALGREVTTLVNQELSRGSYDATFNAAGLSSGIYFYRLMAGTETRMRKMILLK